MIIAGDIGGTKTNLALFQEDEESCSYSHFATYPSGKYPNLRSILKEYLDKIQTDYDLSSLQKASFAIAGPVIDGVCKATNLPWLVDQSEISKSLNIKHVFLLNDLEANAYAIEILSENDLVEIYSGKGEGNGNRAVISPGTGLGEAGLYWDGKKHHPFACEGGHTEFGPRDALQIDLSRYLLAKYGHSSYERILSGPGLHNVYQFYKDVMNRHEPDWLTQEMEHDDPAKVITKYGLNEKSELCTDSLNLFVSILGSEAGNCALKFMAVGGIYLGGGIPPKILPKLKDPLFYKGFTDKGRLKNLLEEVAIRVIKDDKASLKGSALYCRKQLTNPSVFL